MITGDEHTDELINYVISNSQFLDSWKCFYPQIKCLLSLKYREFENRIRDLTVYEDDIWVLTFPKSGTTWIQEMVWLLGNNLDYKAAGETKLSDRFPYIEFSGFDFSPAVINKTVDTITAVETLQQPRFIKTHLPVSLLPMQLLIRKPKIVMVLRDPKDVAVSLYYHYRLFFAYEGTIDKFFEAFMEGAVFCGCYWHHAAEYWKLGHEPNVLLLTYEEMKKNLPLVIRRTASFLNKTVTDEQVAKLADHLSISNMRENDSVNFKSVVNVFKQLHQKDTSGAEFIRNGQVGDHRIKMSPEMVKKFDLWNAKMKNELGISNDFPY